jgi:hypothetical protein
VTGTGVANCTVCQPPAVSSVKVALARRSPAGDHRLPVCVPVFAADL